MPAGALVAMAGLFAASAIQELAAQSESAAPWSFAVGETAVYDVTFGPVKVGHASLAVEASETISGEDVYRVALELEGGPFFYKINDRTVSWIAPDPLRSLRFEQILSQGDYRRHRKYELDHAALTYTRYDWDEPTAAYREHKKERAVPIPEGALDEIAYLFLARSLPLEIGKTYTFERYFEADGNPASIEVLRRERIRVAAGRFDTIVIRPLIRTGGMFGEDGDAEVFVSDDPTRRIVLIRTRMSVGELNMYLREYRAGDG